MLSNEMIYIHTLIRIRPFLCVWVAKIGLSRKIVKLLPRAEKFNGG